MKKIYCFFVVCSLFISFAISNVAGAYQGSLPEVYISDVKLDKTTYNAGDTIKGNFLLKNFDSMVAPEIYYEIKLNGDYVNTIADTTYSHSDMIGPVSLGGNENRTISFEYKIPTSLSGKGFGIQVQSMLENGVGLGWGDAFFTIVNKTPSFVELGRSYLTTSASSTRTYTSQEGPMVYKNEKAYLNIELNNKNKTSEDIYPVLTIYNRSQAKGVLLNRNENTIVAKAKTITKAKIELPVFDYLPKVYVGKLEFKDKAGQIVSNTVDFRYIVFGQMVTINNVASDKEYANKGDMVNVVVDVTGAPFDVNNPEISATSTGSIIVKLYNEANKLVGEKTEQNVNFNNVEIKNYPIKITDKAVTLSASVQILGIDGSVLSEKTVNLTKNPMPPTAQAVPIIYILYALILVMTLAFMFGLWLVYKRETKQAVIVLVAGLVLFVVWLVITSSNKAEAWVELTHNFDDRRGTVTFFINYPQPDQEFLPGQKINVQASASFKNCGNKPKSVNSFTIWNNNDTAQGTALSYVVGQKGNNSFQFAFSSFGLSSYYGSNKLNGLYYIQYHGGNGTGYQPYRTVPPAPTNVVATPSSACGGKIRISWDQVSGANGYEVYKNDVLATTTSDLFYESDGVSTDSFTVKSVVKSKVKMPIYQHKHTVDWQSLAGATGYEVYLSGTLIAKTTASNYSASSLIKNTGEISVLAVLSPVKSAPSKSVSAVPSRPCLSISCSVSATTTTVGVPVTYSATATGGDGHYYYYWQFGYRVRAPLSDFTVNPSSPSVLINKTYDTLGSKSTQALVQLYSVSTGESDETSETLADCPVVTVTENIGPNPILGTPIVSATTSSNCGGKINLTWAEVNDATEYVINKNGISLGTTTNLFYEANSKNGDLFTIVAANATAVSSPSSAVVAVPSNACPVAKVSLIVTKVGNGTVVGGGINCGGVCNISVDKDSVITLTATPANDNELDLWGGACAGVSSDTCSVSMDSNKNVFAKFKLTECFGDSCPPPSGEEVKCKDSLPTGSVILVPNYTIDNNNGADWSYVVNEYTNTTNTASTITDSTDLVANSTGIDCPWTCKPVTTANDVTTRYTKVGNSCVKNTTTQQ